MSHNPSPCLLLLPPPPAPLSPEFLSAAYRPALVAVAAALRRAPTSTKLLIVLPCPSLQGRLNEPRSHIHGEAQKLLGGVYSLFCAVCVSLSVDVDSDTAGSIDARIILLDYKSQTFSIAEEADVDRHICGPIVDLPTLAFTRRRWNTIFSVDGEEGQKLFASYSALSNRIRPPIQGYVEVVGGGLSLIQPDVPSVEAGITISRKHNVVAVGGTFDHIHAGHKLLLSATALLLQPATTSSRSPRRLIVGITGDELLKNKKYAEYLKSWKERQQDVIDFLLSILLFTRSSHDDSVQTTTFDEPVPNGKAVHTHIKPHSITIECCVIEDPFGPTITDEAVTALVVSGETRSGGQAVNEKRAEKGWDTLEVYEIDVLDAQEAGSSSSMTEDFASKISSTAIRKRKAEHGRISSL